MAIWRGERELRPGQWVSGRIPGWTCCVQDTGFFTQGRCLETSLQAETPGNRHLGFEGGGRASSPSTSSERQPGGPPSREGRVWEKGGCRIRGDQEGRWNRVAGAAGACRGGKAPHKSSRGWGVGRGPPSAPGSAEGGTGSRTEPLGSCPGPRALTVTVTVVAGGRGGAASTLLSCPEHLSLV